jgi:hypothetical protein
VPPLVSLDVEPHHPDNTINLASRADLSVAILGSESFDARDVDVRTVTLNGAQARCEREDERRAHTRDVNSDGLPDLILRFSPESLNLTPSDSMVQLRGETRDGLPIQGSDRVRVVRDARHEGRDANTVELADGQLPQNGKLALEAVSVAPSQGAFRVTFSLPNALPATVSLLDIAGRSIAVRELGQFAAGAHAVELIPRVRPTAGIYFLRLVQGNEQSIRKVALVR